MGSTPRSPLVFGKHARRRGADEPSLVRHWQGRRRLKLAFDHTLDGQIGAKGLVDGELPLRLAGERGHAADLAATLAHPPSRAWPARRWRSQSQRRLICRLDPRWATGGDAAFAFDHDALCLGERSGYERDPSRAVGLADPPDPLRPGSGYIEPAACQDQPKPPVALWTVDGLTLALRAAAATFDVLASSERKGVTHLEGDGLRAFAERSGLAAVVSRSCPEKAMSRQIRSIAMFLLCTKISVTISSRNDRYGYQVPLASVRRLA